MPVTGGALLEVPAAALNARTLEPGSYQYLPFILNLPNADDDFLLGPIMAVGRNTFRLRCLPAPGTTVEVFRIIAHPATLAIIPDPSTGNLYDNIASFGAGGLLTNWGPQVAINDFDIQSQAGPFYLYFYTPLGNYAAKQCSLSMYHMMDVNP